MAAFPHPVIRDALLLGQIDAFHQAVVQGAPVTLKENLLLSALLRLVDRHSRVKDPPGSRKGEPRKLHPAVLRAISLIQSQGEGNIRLSELSDQVGLNPRYLIRLFTKEVGLPPHAFFVNNKIHAAKRLIAYGGSLSEIAFRTGFSDQSHLTRVFRSHLGVTPGQYARIAAAARQLPVTKPDRLATEKDFKAGHPALHAKTGQFGRLT